LHTIEARIDNYNVCIKTPGEVHTLDKETVKQLVKEFKTPLVKMNERWRWYDHFATEDVMQMGGERWPITWLDLVDESMKRTTTTLSQIEKESDKAKSKIEEMTRVLSGAKHDDEKAFEKAEGILTKCQEELALLTVEEERVKKESLKHLSAPDFKYRHDCFATLDVHVLDDFAEDDKGFCYSGNSAKKEDNPLPRLRDEFRPDEFDNWIAGTDARWAAVEIDDENLHSSVENGMVPGIDGSWMDGSWKDDSKTDKSNGRVIGAMSAIEIKARRRLAREARARSLAARRRRLKHEVQAFVTQVSGVDVNVATPSLRVLHHRSLANAAIMAAKNVDAMSPDELTMHRRRMTDGIRALADLMEKIEEQQRNDRLCR